MLRQRRRRVQPPTWLFGNSRWHQAYTLQRQHEMMYSTAVSEVQTQPALRLRILWFECVRFDLSVCPDSFMHWVLCLHSVGVSVNNTRVHPSYLRR